MNPQPLGYETSPLLLRYNHLNIMFVLLAPGPRVASGNNKLICATMEMYFGPPNSAPPFKVSRALGSINFSLVFSHEDI